MRKTGFPIRYAGLFFFCVRVFFSLFLLFPLSPLFSLDAQSRLTDALGRNVELKSAARRVVSLSPGVTEILFAIGAGGYVAGRTAYCDYPAAAASVPVVGGFSGATVSVEQIAMLKPDLAIVSADMHQRLIPLLEGLGIAVFTVEPRNFEEVYATIGTVGTLTGCEENAAAVVQAMKSKIARVEARGQRARTVFWELTATPLMTTGGDTFVNEAIKKAGGRNIFENEKSGWIQVSFEQVLLRNPDWIISGSDHAVDAASRPLWRSISAVKNKRIATVDADLVYRYGPRLADAVIAIAEILR
jgi:iron complex transport system substrate-binding protein